MFRFQTKSQYYNHDNEKFKTKEIVDARQNVLSHKPVTHVQLMPLDESQVIAHCLFNKMSHNAGQLNYDLG